MAIVALLVSVTGFSTLAKNVQYLPKSNPAHFLSIASKMKTDCSPVTVEPPPVEPRATIVPLALPSQSVTRFDRIEERETQFTERIGASISVRHRPPPISLS
jgi:hypothetical protein